MLPPGPHMVSYNAASRTGDFAPTVSFFTHLETSQVLTRRWDAEQELLIDVPSDEVYSVHSQIVDPFYLPHGQEHSLRGCSCADFEHADLMSISAWLNVQTQCGF